MSFAPLIPFSGFDGFAFQRANRAAQLTAYTDAEKVSTSADLSTFRTVAPTLRSASQLANNAVALRVSLQAFGLGDAEVSPAFVEAALSADPADEAAFLKRFGDGAWLEMNRAFGFGGFGLGKTAEPGFADEIVARHRLTGLDRSIGASDPSLRRALTFDRVVADLASVSFDDPRDGWRLALADDEVREVMQTALGLDASFELAGMEKRIDMAVAAWRRTDPAGTGALASLADAGARDGLIERFFANARRATVAAPPSPARADFAGFLDVDRSREAAQARLDVALRRDPEFVYFRRAMDEVEAAVGPLASTPQLANQARVEAFVADDRLVAFTLRSFGLGDRAPTDDFMRQVLLSDPADDASFAARQGDPRWREMARSFGFGAEDGAQTVRFGFEDRFLDRAAVARFEEAASGGDAAMRAALLTDRTLETLSTAGLSTEEGWRRAMATPAVAQVLTDALGLTDRLAGAPQDARIDAVREAARAEWRVERVDDFARDLNRSTVIREFFRAQADGADAPRGGLLQPIIPVGGNAGWAFLQRTMDDQKASFLNNPTVARDMAHFRETIASVRSVDDLLGDRRLLGVALQAFGLEGEIDKTAFIRRVLEEGTETQSAAANRLPDPRWREMARAFGFGDGPGPQTTVAGFADRILKSYGDRAFEIGVGEVDQSLRLALNFQRTAESLARQDLSETATWFRLLGDPATRSFVETMFNLPREFAQVDVDRQVETLIARADRTFGASIRDIGDPALREEMVNRFLALDTLRTGAAGPTAGQTALTLLQSAARPGGGLLSARL